MNERLMRLMRLHRLHAPAGDDGADTGGTETLEEPEGEGDGGPGDTGEAEGEGEADEAGEGEPDEVVVTLGDEPAPTEEEEEKRAPEWVRELRKSNREKDRALRERDAEIARLKGATGQAGALVVGPKPTLEGCDYDADKFAEEFEAWTARKLQVEQQATEQEKTAQAAQAAWQAKLDAYGKAKSALKVRDFDDAEAVVMDTFNTAQQGIMLDGADNPAVLAYALGKNPKKARELAAITSPVKFAFAVAKLEAQLKVQPRKSAPVPEKTLRSGAAGAAAVDNQLERLRAEAEKTGDLSKVIAYKNAQRRK